MAENVGYPVDGSIVVTVTTDFRDAFLSIYPPVNGGKKMTYDDVMDALTAKGVRYGIKHEDIRRMIDDDEYDSQIVAAHMKAPVDGIDGKVRLLYSTEVDLKPKSSDSEGDDGGIVDLKDLGYVRIVDEGTVIAEMTPPTEGIPGIDVRGVEIRQTKGRKVDYKLGENTVLSEDGTKVIAAQTGHLVYEKGGFAVKTTLVIPRNVDSSIGNINFLGDVVVKGEVCEGFKISSGKSVVVTGNVNGAVIEAGEEVVSKRGIINSTITAHKNITALFCEFSKLTCDGDLSSQSFLNCEVYCAGVMTAGKRLIGGKYICLHNLEAGSIGNSSYIPTDVILGDNAILSEDKKELERQIASADSDIAKCTQVIDFLSGKKKELKRLSDENEELLGKMLKSRIQLQHTKKQVTKQIAEIDKKLENIQYYQVECRGTIFPGSRIVINDKSISVTREERRVRVSIDESGDIKLAPFR